MMSRSLGMLLAPARTRRGSHRICRELYSGQSQRKYRRRGHRRLVVPTLQPFLVSLGASGPQSAPQPHLVCREDEIGHVFSRLLTFIPRFFVVGTACRHDCAGPSLPPVSSATRFYLLASVITCPVSLFADGVSPFFERHKLTACRKEVAQVTPNPFWSPWSCTSK